MGAGLRAGWQLAEVLAMVKTYPAPSTKHGETVCVAGVRLDGEPAWIRLYPIPFRALDDDRQFRKYQRIRVPVQARGSYDPRPESYVPDLGRIELLGEPVKPARNWAARRQLIGHLPGATTTCELISLNKAATMADSVQSLGMVKPREILDVQIEEGAPWKPNQLEKVKKFSQADLFNPDGFPELQPVPFQLLVNYTCMESGCRGHNQHLIDWELGVMGLKWPSLYGPRTSGMILGKYRQILDLEKNDVHLIVGNQHQRRATFSICGLWYPKKA